MDTRASHPGVGHMPAQGGSRGVSVFAARAMAAATREDHAGAARLRQVGPWYPTAGVLPLRTRGLGRAIQPME
jgi:hypothetical protein